MGFWHSRNHKTRSKDPEDSPSKTTHHGSLFRSHSLKKLSRRWSSNTISSNNNNNSNSNGDYQNDNTNISGYQNLSKVPDQQKINHNGTSANATTTTTTTFDNNQSLGGTANNKDTHHNHRPPSPEGSSSNQNNSGGGGGSNPPLSHHPTRILSLKRHFSLNHNNNNDNNNNHHHHHYNIFSQNSGIHRHSSVKSTSDGSPSPTTKSHSSGSPLNVASGSRSSDDLDYQETPEPLLSGDALIHQRARGMSIAPPETLPGLTIPKVSTTRPSSILNESISPTPQDDSSEFERFLNDEEEKRLEKKKTRELHQHELEEEYKLDPKTTAYHPLSADHLPKITAHPSIDKKRHGLFSTHALSNDSSSHFSLSSTNSSSLGTKLRGLRGSKDLAASSESPLRTMHQQLFSKSNVNNNTTTTTTAITRSGSLGATSHHRSRSFGHNNQSNQSLQSGSNTRSGTLEDSKPLRPFSFMDKSHARHKSMELQKRTWSKDGTSPPPFTPATATATSAATDSAHNEGAIISSDEFSDSPVGFSDEDDDEDIDDEEEDDEDIDDEEEDDKDIYNEEGGENPGKDWKAKLAARHARRRARIRRHKMMLLGLLDGSGTPPVAPDSSSGVVSLSDDKSNGFCDNSKQLMRRVKDKVVDPSEMLLIAPGRQLVNLHNHIVQAAVQVPTLLKDYGTGSKSLGETSSGPSMEKKSSKNKESTVNEVPTINNKNAFLITDEEVAIPDLSPEISDKLDDDSVDDMSDIYSDAEDGISSSMVDSKDDTGKSSDLLETPASPEYIYKNNKENTTTTINDDNENGDGTGLAPKDASPGILRSWLTMFSGSPTQQQETLSGGYENLEELSKQQSIGKDTKQQQEQEVTIDSTLDSAFGF
ncbi:uncharacterized protein SAPINGB_P000985 [Magnusiomyces paraingens]|uniref:Uncharacterized protein n=1 Tax=Magnusiomyces paraingens TaxID=2606893 RepID=A0A5E8B3C2_9ASCO|nr:uncharacterized protein SAPINGB_P000985 [Saprochaete ingens]VVT45977.1 unnamed protein product [Saprochaete ingens]